MLKSSAIGNVGKDAVVRHVGGKNVVSFSIAHNEKYQDKQGVKHERTTWIDCSLWRDDDAKIAGYLKRGQLVYVEGVPSAEGYVQKDSGEVRGSFRLNVRKLELLGTNNQDGAEDDRSENQSTAPAAKNSKPLVTAETVDDPTAAW